MKTVVRLKIASAPAGPRNDGGEGGLAMTVARWSFAMMLASMEIASALRASQ